MAVKIPEKLQDLFKRPLVCALATLMPDGQPQVTPVWFDYDGEHLIINTARGRQKDRNLKKGAKVTALIVDPQNSMHWAEARGEVAEETEENAHAAFMALGLRYTGKAEYRQLNPGEVRVTYKIAIKKINGD
jgi:PPOX class probable F420-dependent enzyme